MSARLEPLDGAADLPLDRPLTLVGRHPSCDVQLESERVSRRHCCLAVLGDGVAVRDLGSTNGTKVNGQRIVQTMLSPGDVLSIGRFRYRLVVDSPRGWNWTPETELWESGASLLGEHPSAPAAERSFGGDGSEGSEG